MISVNRDPDGILKTIRCFALDMDGTLYLGHTLLPGAAEFIAQLRETGRRLCFLTNNSSKSRADYAAKLATLGIAANPATEIITSGTATIRYLLQHHPGKRIFLLGNQTLRAEFERSGIALDTDAPELVVTAFDTSLDYQKLCRLCELVSAGLPYIATHPDFVCPVEGGFVPDIGAIQAFVRAATGRDPDTIVGKPHAPIIDALLSVTGIPPIETAMVGDRLYTDIAAAQHNGLTGILVLSGETKLCDLADAAVQPRLIFDSVGEMIPYL